MSLLAGARDNDSGKTIEEKKVIGLSLEKLRKIYYRARAIGARAILGREKLGKKLFDLRTENLVKTTQEKYALKIKEIAERTIIDAYDQARSRDGIHPRIINSVIECVSKESSESVDVNKLANVLKEFEQEELTRAVWYAGRINAARKIVEEMQQKALKSRLERIRLANKRRKYKGRPPLKLE